MKYLEQYKQIHKRKVYGTSGERLVSDLSELIPADADSILDYGAGQSQTGFMLRKTTGIRDVIAYDPAVEGRDVKPERNFDVVVCTDVLEHVPEEELNEVLTDIWGYADMRAIFVIAFGPAGEILPNGENAHCTVHDKDWWAAKLKTVWKNVEVRPSPNHNSYWGWFVCDSE